MSIGSLLGAVLALTVASGYDGFPYLQGPVLLGLTRTYRANLVVWTPVTRPTSKVSRATMSLADFPLLPVAMVTRGAMMGRLRLAQMATSQGDIGLHRWW